MFGQVWTIAFLALVVAGLVSGSPLLAAMGGAGLLVAGGTWLWSRVSMERLSYDRRLSRGRAFPGEVLDLAVSITNRKGVPLTWVRSEEDVPEGLQVLGKDHQGSNPHRTARLTHSTYLSSFERVRWGHRVRCGPRGLYRLGPATLRTGDPFGFFPRAQRSEAREALLVYPRTIPLPDLRLPARWPVGDRQGLRHLHGDPARPAGTREYQPGDPWRHIDWKATARRGELQVKVLETGASLTTAVVANIDTVGSSYEGYIPHHLERVATVSASLAQEALAGGQSVGLVTNGKSLLYERPMSVPLGRSQQHLTLILEALAMLGPFVGAPIEVTLVEGLRRLPPEVTTVLVTAMMTPGLVQALELLQRQGRGPVMVWVADPEPDQVPAGVSWRNLAPYLASMEARDGHGS